MSRRERLEVINQTPIALANAAREPEGKNSLNSFPVELQLRIVHYLSRRYLPTICQLNKHWRSVGTDELLRRLLPIFPHRDDRIHLDYQLKRVFHHFLDGNHVNALQRLLEFRPENPYIHPRSPTFRWSEPVSLRSRMTKEEEQRPLLPDYSFISSWAVRTAFKYNDMSCTRLLIEHGLADYRCLLDLVVYDEIFDCHFIGEWLARPFPGPDSGGDHNSVLHWLLAYPPRHVVQAMLLSWGQPILHPRLRPLCDGCDSNSPDDSKPCDNVLILVVSRGHPASLRTIDELRMMVEILTDDASGCVIPEGRQPLSHALRIARGIASMWPGTPPRVAEYLRSVCTWETHHSISSGGRSSNNINNPPPPLAPPLIPTSHDPVLHRLIDLKTYGEMLRPENWQELQRVEWQKPLVWLVSTEFLADKDAARRMRCFKQALWMLYYCPDSTNSLLHAAGAFRRWRCVDVLLDELRGRWPRRFHGIATPDCLLRRAILDAVQGEPGCADGCIIRKLLLTDTRSIENCKGFDFDEDMTIFSPFRGGWVSWESFRLAFVERQQDRENRETPASVAMRDAVLDCLTISDQEALDFLGGEASKTLYRASSRRRQKRLAGKQEGSNGGEGCEESSCCCSTSSSGGGGGGGCP